MLVTLFFVNGTNALGHVAYMRFEACALNTLEISREVELTPDRLVWPIPTLRPGIKCLKNFSRLILDRSVWHIIALRPGIGCLRNFSGLKRGRSALHISDL